MANFTVSALTIFILWFFTRSLVAAQKMDARVDICIILTPEHTSGEIKKLPMVQAATEFVSHLELGEGKTRIALVTGVTRKEDKDKGKLLLKLIGSQGRVKKELDEWLKYEIRAADLWNSFDTAFKTARDDVFDHSVDRAKAVLFIIPWWDAAFINEKEEKEMVIAVARDLRSRGIWIYVMADWPDQVIAMNLTADARRIVYSQHSEFGHFIVRDNYQVRDALYNDLCQWKYYCHRDNKTGKMKDGYSHPYVNDAGNLCKEPEPPLLKNCTSEATTLHDPYIKGTTKTTSKAGSSFRKVAQGMTVGDLLLILTGVLMFVRIKQEG